MRTIGSGPTQRHSVADPLYVSDLFPVPANKNINHIDSKGFLHFVNLRYGTSYSGERGCGGNFRTMDEAREAKEKFEAHYKDDARRSPSAHPNANIVETGWMWSEQH